MQKRQGPGCLPQHMVSIKNSPLIVYMTYVESSSFYDKGHAPTLRASKNFKKNSCSLATATSLCKGHQKLMFRAAFEIQYNLVKWRYLKGEFIRREKLIREQDGRLHANPSGLGRNLLQERRIWRNRASSLKERRLHTCRELNFHGLKRER